MPSQAGKTPINCNFLMNFYWIYWAFLISNRRRLKAGNESPKYYSERREPDWPRRKAKITPSESLPRGRP